jgi:serine/threonine protein kinase
VAESDRSGVPPAENGGEDRVERTFNSAIERPTDQRLRFVDEACKDNAELGERVRRLLGAYERAGDKLDDIVSPELEYEFGRLKPEEAGDGIGPYVLREKLGEGGFGVVWVADQEKPVRRRVALKIVKLGMDTKEVIARFEQERQALAMMDHPHIAKVFDAGATQWGRLYFVMELVRGIKITDYCDQANLPTTERLALFIHVCNAVQHAHQKGIIHRDLKPSNILVTLHDGVPVPKVIDFGVAKATQQQRLTDLTIYTQFQQIIGTPVYMSPEQAEMSGLDIDTRSDIYSLGVLLYELLTGRTPFDPVDLMKQGLDEIRRTIREVEPQTPSMVVRTMADETRIAVARVRQSDRPN